ncbi:CCR4-NOT transcription complex subunit 2-like [Dromiciops gliroides]|uniref:CCR4-NOT transcription complex subunit 2-like n=1 Tax=Dromiciops gliroides TaxID=33562 RepID=UPI001CC8102B|nr:CCR4-NOT transcription complex subunit 2-like [Dromiciops gliroides]XP_043830750.1 CCR4-NOT transcription complex subunit 2-like [Dromiciops gliroides]
MFGASRSKSVEGVNRDNPEEKRSYSQPGLFAQGPGEGVLASPSRPVHLSTFGASLYGPHRTVGLAGRGRGSSTHQLNRSSSQGTGLPSHLSPTAGVPRGLLQWPPPPSRGILPVNLRNRKNQSQVGQGTGMASRSNSMSSSGLGSPYRGSPSMISMPGQPPSRQAFPVKTKSGFRMNRNKAFGMKNSLLSDIFNAKARSENVAGLDLSDFPPLTNPNRKEGSGNPTPFVSPLAAGAPHVRKVKKPASEQSQDISLHKEDFPALPGSSFKDPTESNEDSESNLYTPGKTFSSPDGPKSPGDEISTAQSYNQQEKGIQVLPDGLVTNIPQGMVKDQFGMTGLLAFIREAKTNPGMEHHALGSDFTTLGLNLTSPENLYPTFASPWASSPCQPQDIDFHVPSEYLTNIHIKDKLPAVNLGLYGEDLLFYLYYTNGGDMLQLLAAVELFDRGWRYHKEERVWITRVPGMEPTVKTSTSERGTYYFFDCLSWSKVAKEFLLEYDKFEGRPHMPSSVKYNPAQHAF